MIRLTKLALRRPVTIILCLITIAYFGFQSVMGMKLELTPEMEMPMLIIATVYPGASPEDVTDLVTKKEEDAITSLDSVDKVQSISRENVSIVIVQYEYGTNMDTAYINLKKAIDGIQGDLPDDANDPNIMELDINSMATVTLAVSGDVDQNLYTYVDDKIVPEFEKLSSVGEVSIAGGQESYTRVELIPEKLAQYHLNMNTVAQLVGAADFTIPAGDVRVGKQDLDVSVGNEFKSTESLKNVVLPLANGETIHLSDIANVYEALEDANSIGRYNGEDVISLGIKKQQSSTAIEVSNQVTKKVQEIEQQYPGLKITVVDDASDTLKRSLSSVIQTLLLAIILSMIILFLFYGDLRASVIVGTSIPISVVLAIICMAAMGFSMNIISLTSLVLDQRPRRMFPGEGKTGFLRRGAGRYAHDDRLDHRRYADNLCCIYSASDVKRYVWTALYTARLHDHLLYDGFLILGSHHRAALLYVLASSGEGSCAGRTHHQRHPGLVPQAYAAGH